MRTVEHLCEKLSDAKVEWKYQAGIYHFTIDDGATRFSIQFTEQFLLRKSDEDLEEEIHRRVEPYHRVDLSNRQLVQRLNVSRKQC